MLAQEQTSRGKANRQMETQPQCDIDAIKTLNVRSVYCQCVSGLFYVWCKEETFLLFLFHQSVCSLSEKHHCYVGYYQVFFLFYFILARVKSCYQELPPVSSSLCLLSGVYQMCPSIYRCVT